MPKGKSKRVRGKSSILKLPCDAPGLPRPPAGHPLMNPEGISPVSTDLIPSLPIPSVHCALWPQPTVWGILSWEKTTLTYHSFTAWYTMPKPLQNSRCTTVRAGTFTTAGAVWPMKACLIPGMETTAVRIPSRAIQDSPPGPGDWHG